MQNSCDWTPHQLLQQEPSENIPKFTAILCSECHSLEYGDVSASYIYMSICAPQLCSTNGSLSTIHSYASFFDPIYKDCGDIQEIYIPWEWYTELENNVQGEK